MAGLYSLWRISEILEEYATPVCPHWQDNPIQRLLFFFDFSPLVVMAYLFAASLLTWDVFIVGVSLVVYADWAVNIFLNYAIIRQPGPQGPYCIYTPYQNPAYNVEQIAVIFMMYVCLGIVYRTWRLPWYTAVLVCLNTALLIANHVYRRVNTVEAVLIGGLVGMIDGFLGFLLLYWAVPRLSHFLDYMRWPRLIGLRNYYFRSHVKPETLLLLDHPAPPETFLNVRQLPLPDFVKQDQMETDRLRLCLYIWALQLLGNGEADKEGPAKKRHRSTRLELLANDIRRGIVLTEAETDFCEWMQRAIGNERNHLQEAMLRTIDDCRGVWQTIDAESTIN